MNHHLRNYFLAGLGFLLPFGIAFVLLKAIFLVVSGVTHPFLAGYMSGPAAGFLDRLVSFVVTLALVTLTGFIISKVVGRSFVKRIDDLLSRVPIVAEIYGSVRKLTSMLSGHDGFEKRFQRVVLVEWPKSGAYSMALVTSEIFEAARRSAGKELMVVFVPTPPNPVNGLLLMVPANSVIPLDLRVDEAIRIIFSLGLSA